MPKVITFTAPVRKFYGESKTTATTRIATTIPTGTHSIITNCSGDWRMQLAPPLILCCKTADNEVTFTDYTTEATDKSTSTSVTLSSLNTAANGNYWYVFCKEPFGGIWVDVDSANGTASVMSGYYWAGSWIDVSITDGSASGGACLAIDGAITWTVPSVWQSAFLSDLFPGATISNLPSLAKLDKLYGIRFQVSAQVDSSTTLDEVAILEDATTYPAGWFQADTDISYNINRDNSGCLEYYDAVGSKTLYLTYAMEY